MDTYRPQQSNALSSLAWPRQLDALLLAFLPNDGRIFGELTLSHTFDNAHNSAAAYIHSCEAPDAAYHLVYDGPGMSLTNAPQFVPVNLVHLDGSPALTGHYMVDIAATHDGQDPLETSSPRVDKRYPSRDMKTSNRVTS